MSLLPSQDQIADSAAENTGSSSVPTAVLLSAWAVLLSATVFVFARSVHGELVYDDLLMIGRNPELGSLTNIPHFFTRSYWAFLEPETRVGFWRPLTATGLAIGHWIGGGAVWGLHLMSLGAHLLAVTGAFLLALRMFSPRVAFFGALLFALHPVQVESVAWITALNDPLYVGFVFLGLWCWIGWRRSGSIGLPWATAACFLPALLAKETGLVLIPLVFLFDILHERSREPISRSSNLRGFGLLGAVIALWFVARVLVFESPWAGLDLVSTHLGVSKARLALLRLELFGGALGLFVWPYELTLFRPFQPTLPPGDRSLVLACAATLVFLVLLIGAWRKRAIGVCFALAFIPCALSIMLVRVESLGIFPLSDRFLSLAAFGFCMAVSAFFQRALGKSGTLAVCLLALIYGMLSYQRIDVWRNEETLFRDAAVKAPRSPYVHWGLGRVLLRRYLATDDAGYLNEAEQAFLAAQDLLVESREADTDVLAGATDFLQTNLGYGWTRLLQDERSGYEGSAVALDLFVDLAERTEAVEERRLEARSLGINYEVPYLELEQVYTAVGVAQTRAGSLEKAETAFRRALERNANYPEAHQNLGRLYAELEEWDLASRHFSRAAELRPGNVEDRLLQAQASAKLGDLETAGELARGLIEDTSHAEPACVLAEIAIARQDVAEAIRWVDHALNLEPDNGQAWYLRAQTFVLRQDSASAIEALRRAIELRPDHFASAYDLGVLLHREGQVAEATTELVRAYGLCQDQNLRPQLREAIASVPGLEAETLVQLAIVDARRTDNESALTWLDQALALAPDHPQATLQRARLLKRLERHQEAVPLMRRACELSPRSFAALTEFGAYLTDLEQREEAREVLQRARNVGPPIDWPAELANEAVAELQRRLEALGPG